MPPTVDLALARARALRLARRQEHVISRRQLYAAGVPRWAVRNELRVGRWQRTGRQTVVVHNGPLTAAARRWIAVLECGPRAALDGVSCLQALGVTALTDAVIHVIVPKGARKPRLDGVRIHESRRWRAEDVVEDGIRRTKASVAAVHAALWAVSDRQAQLFVVLSVQQGLAAVTDVHDALAEVRRHVRRRMLHALLLDLSGGVRSLGELDVARAMRRRGLPEPRRQVVRRRASGTHYLDADFPEHQVVLEVDGAQHDELDHRLGDLLRDVAASCEGSTTVRIPLVAWRLDEEAVLDALERLFTARGWRRPAA